MTSAQLFDKLTIDREENAHILDKQSMKGVKTSVVDKYSDQAHFIYELLQNADDVKATEANFLLKEDGLIFTHNGTDYFSLTDVDQEEMDTRNGKLGHINSITSIANSSKQDNSATIGKFGVGFKAVFQYTNTPHIYDPNFRFKIERFIVPKQLDSDNPERKENETLFWFPFDVEQKSSDSAFKDIANKLKSLSHPTLFLSKLKKVKWAIGGDSGEYSARTIEKRNEAEMMCELIELRQSVGEKVTLSKFWVFSKKINKSELVCSVGWHIDENDRLVPIVTPAYCFFPTKEKTELKFMVHAPFLLTDSREGIKAAESWNKMLVEQISRISARSLVLLRDIGIEKNHYYINEDLFNVIPYNPELFEEIGSVNRISFLPVYKAIKNVLATENILPCRGNRYCSSECAFWASDANLTDLITDEQLTQLLRINEDIGENEEAFFVFPGLEKKKLDMANRPLSEYISGYYGYSKYNDVDPDLVNSVLDPTDVLRKIDASFINDQKQEWLLQFYTYLDQRPTLWRDRNKFVKQLPIFIDKQNQAVSAFNSEGYLVLFEPTDEETLYNTIHPEIFKESECAEFARNFGICLPDLKDEIYNLILPIYSEEEFTIDLDINAVHVKKFFELHQKSTINDQRDLIKRLKQLPVINIVLGEENFLTRPEQCYIPTNELKEYFKNKPDVQFVDMELYQEHIPKESWGSFEFFLIEIGNSKLPRFLEVEMELSQNERRELGLSNNFTRYSNIYDIDLDGREELVKELTLQNSVILWNMLCRLIKHYGIESFRIEMWGIHRYFYGVDKTEYFESSEEKYLRSCEWLFGQNEQLLSPDSCSLEDLHEEYLKSFDNFRQLANYLGIKDQEEELEKLTPEQRARYELGLRLEKEGLTIDDIDDELMQLVKRKRKKSPLIEKGFVNDVGSSRLKVMKELQENMRSKPVPSDIFSMPNEKEPEAIMDSDQFNVPTLNVEKKIERMRDRLQDEIDELSIFNFLYESVASEKVHSYKWFKTLLELETLNNQQNYRSKDSFSIRFSEVEQEPGTERTLILRHPDRYIPQTIEEIGDISMSLLLNGKEKRDFTIEVVSVKEYTLRAKLKSINALAGIDMGQVSMAVIDIKNPIFILEELKKHFETLPYEDDHDMHSNLTPNIEFIFGPPGTGKTTHLAGKTIPELLNNDEQCRILVLTPTNKASDVLTKRIIELDDKMTYLDWLVRFGNTGDESIEMSGIYYDRVVDISTMKKCVMVTTMARFPYDHALNGETNERYYLKDFIWDHIIIDEASMVPLINMVNLLYQRIDANFIIAGDPFQIQPITSIDIWKDQNIYSFVQLDKFRGPKTVPHDYKVTNLTTQYRSIPSIGTLFSEFTYDGILDHEREAGSQKELIVEGVRFKDINVIKFPVSRFESIYRSKRLNKTPYHVYSAIFALEFIQTLSKNLRANGSEIKSIGVICPYRAQADLVDKLLAASELGDNPVEINVGTIHGFQGDECEVVIALFNPPPTLSSLPDMFLNKQNILNVSISRAKDYLFLMIPDDSTEGVENLQLINRIGRIAKEKCGEKMTLHRTTDLEKAMFGSASYIEENSFITAHQSVNVYFDPEKIYEVRCEDHALDVQIGRKNK